ncbi:VOC family protein [Nitrosomonas marina]|uniref:VOC domain-containing protein n=1 Tax=Nitrosomonas marina TaxID=917 RepID=A0A1H8C8G9_9PROT|nr:VOC family protein [Nitrosomonas marina]SEM91169.1 hypothetical protein SAMN05216325_10458 [Nitrosomonas marina]
MQNPVGWFEIYVDDMAKAKSFYEAVFECELEQLSSPDVELWCFSGDQNAYGAMGALVKMEGCTAGGNSTIVYFACDDCAIQQARSAEHGGKVLKEKFSIGEYGFIALVADTEGNMIGLHSMK